MFARSRDAHETDDGAAGGDDAGRDSSGIDAITRERTLERGAN